MSLNTFDLCCAVSDRTGVSRADTQKVIDRAVKEIVDAMRNGDEVIIRGFGVFIPITRKPRKIRDINTGERISTTPSRSFYFRASRGLKRL